MASLNHAFIPPLAKKALLTHGNWNMLHYLYYGEEYFYRRTGKFLHQLYFNLHNYFYFSMAWCRMRRRDTKQACYIHFGGY